MKKTNLLKGALSVLAVSVLLASCTQVDSKIDKAILSANSKIKFSLT